MDEDATNERMSGFLARRVPEYAAMSPEAKAIRSVSLPGRDPEENTTFGRNADHERDHPWRRKLHEAVSERTVLPEATMMFGTASTYVLLPVLVFTARPLYVPRT